MKNSEDWDDLEDLDFSSSVTRIDMKNKNRQSDDTLCRQVEFFYVCVLFGLTSLGFTCFFIMLLSVDPETSNQVKDMQLVSLRLCLGCLLDTDL